MASLASLMPEFQSAGAQLAGLHCNLYSTFTMAIALATFQPLWPSQQLAFVPIARAPSRNLAPLALSLSLPSPKSRTAGQKKHEQVEYIHIHVFSK